MIYGGSTNHLTETTFLKAYQFWDKDEEDDDMDDDVSIQALRRRFHREDDE